jgi:mRNA interferase RelE/StbE
MAGYNLVVKESVIKDIRAFPKDDITRILKAFESLAIDPRRHGAEKLSEQERYRYRVGTYRILYEIQDSAIVVTIVKVAHRREAYR